MSCHLYRIVLFLVVEKKRSEAEALRSAFGSASSIALQCECKQDQEAVGVPVLHSVTFVSQNATFYIRTVWDRLSLPQIIQYNSKYNTIAS